jgi:hypothetical protein
MFRPKGDHHQDGLWNVYKELKNAAFLHYLPRIKILYKLAWWLSTCAETRSYLTNWPFCKFCCCCCNVFMVCYTRGLTFCCFSYMHFVLICNVVVLYRFVMCVCVCVCVGFVMCGCFGNMYTVLWLRFFLTWLRFFRAFSSVVRQIPRQNSQRRGTVRTFPH